MTRVLCRCRGSIFFLLASRSSLIGRWSKFQKGWRWLKMGESRINGKFFWVFINQNLYNSLFLLFLFLQNYTKREMPRISYWLPWYWKYYDSDTRGILKYFLNIYCLAFSVCEHSKYPDLTVNSTVPFCSNCMEPLDFLGPES